MNSMAIMVEGHDYFSYQCSECEQKVVTLRQHNHPVQCSHVCVETHVKRIKKTFASINTSKHLNNELGLIDLEINLQPIQLDE